MPISLDFELIRIWPNRQVEQRCGFPLSPDEEAGAGQDGCSSWVAGKAGVLQKSEVSRTKGTRACVSAAVQDAACMCIQFPILTVSPPRTAALIDLF